MMFHHAAPPHAAPRVWVGAITQEPRTSIAMSPHRLHSVSPATAALARLVDVGGLSYLLGVAVAMVSAVVHDLFGFLFLCCVGASWMDYHWGKKVAEHREALDPGHLHFNPALATIGFQSKMMGLALLLLVRGLEWWALLHSLGDVAVPGLLSVIVGVAFIKHEADSMDRNAKSIGKTIPAISAGLAALDALDRTLRPRAAAPRPPPSNG